MNLLSPYVRTLLFRLGTLAMLSLLPLLSGCVILAAGAAGAGAVAYVRGELEANVEADLEAVFKATQRALRKLEFAKISEQSSVVDAHLLARTALDKRVEVKLSRVTNQLTKVEIRIGLVGDQALSLTILDKIKAELK